MQSISACNVAEEKLDALIYNIMRRVVCCKMQTHFNKNKDNRNELMAHPYKAIAFMAEMVPIFLMGAGVVPYTDAAPEDLD